MSRIMKRQLVSSEQAETMLTQHKKPCDDCPFARTALKGWLGSMSIQDWIRAAHGESFVDCHVTTNMQCAGVAIYRANVCKLPWSPNLKLPPDDKLVFSSPMEFTEHHQIKRKK